MKNLGLYIHIPFCESKCYYCDFLSFSKNDHRIDNYISYLRKEIKLYSSKLNDYKLKTIFIGGGTPSYIEAKHIYNILEDVFRYFNVRDLEEISIEANPKTLSDNKLYIYNECGINRISIGAQSLDDNILNNIGRIHTKKDFINCLNRLKKHGFVNINVDIMFNLPNQGIDNVLSTLNDIIKLDIKHISFYSLKIEKGTLFYKKYNKGQLNLPNEEIERDMYHLGIKLLEQNGYKQYEISNFSKINYECKHNLFYWELKPYLGVGLGAHSNIEDKRWSNLEQFEKYFKKIDENNLPIKVCDSISQMEKMSEFIILGLRLNKGISIKQFKKRFGINLPNDYIEKIKKFQKQGLIDITKDRVYLTNKGRDLSNLVFIEFLP